jgi:hypothetical protein
MDRCTPAKQPGDLAIPDCLITDYEDLTEGLALPDKDDRHVLAAAIRGHADAIVTTNLRHFGGAAVAELLERAHWPNGDSH